MTKQTVRKVLDFLDLFQKPLPSFNIRGKRQVSSFIGGVSSFFIALILIMYATVKFTDMMSRSNPNISRHIERDAIDPTEKFNLHDLGLSFAFGIEGFLDRELKDDPRYVKMMLRMVFHKEGKEYDKILPYRMCKASDWEKFAPPINDSYELLQKYTNEPDRNLFCIDWDTLGDEIELWGT